jgi:hypothetical protein
MLPQEMRTGMCLNGTSSRFIMSINFEQQSYWEIDSRSYSKISCLAWRLNDDFSSTLGPSSVCLFLPFSL